MVGTIAENMELYDVTQLEEQQLKFNLFASLKLKKLTNYIFNQLHGTPCIE